MVKKQEFLKNLAQKIVQQSPERTLRVAVDGVDGAGKSIFADELAAIIGLLKRPVIRASVDGFHNPKIIRYARGKQSPEGFFRDSYNYTALKQLLLEPLSADGNQLYHTAAFDHVTDALVPLVEQRAFSSSVFLLDGIFLHRPELLPYWDFSIFLRVDFSVSVARCSVRDGTSTDPEAQGNLRYVNGQRLYFEECAPETKATIVVDYNDLLNPTILVDRSH